MSSLGSYARDTAQVQLWRIRIYRFLTPVAPVPRDALRCYDPRVPCLASELVIDDQNVSANRINKVLHNG
jgi:hypothetical protein